MATQINKLPQIPQVTPYVPQQTMAARSKEELVLQFSHVETVIDKNLEAWMQLQSENNRLQTILRRYIVSRLEAQHNS